MANFAPDWLLHPAALALLEPEVHDAEVLRHHLPEPRLKELWIGPFSEGRVVHPRRRDHGEAIALAQREGEPPTGVAGDVEIVRRHADEHGGGIRRLGRIASLHEINERLGYQLPAPVVHHGLIERERAEDADADPVAPLEVGGEGV